MSKDLLKLKQEIIEAGKRLIRTGLVTGTGGNISARLPGDDKFLITPSGMDYEVLQPEDIVLADLDAKVLEGSRKPSIETSLHAGIYRKRPDAGAIVHTHSLYASAVAAARISIPPILDSMVSSLGGGIDCAEYGIPGSPELAAATAAALGSKNGALMANHGAIGVGPDMAKAYARAELVERAALTFICACAIGQPAPLDMETMNREKTFLAANYGQKKQ